MIIDVGVGFGVWLQDGQIDFEEFAAMMRKGSEKSNGAMMSKSQEGEKNGNEGSSQQHGRGGGGRG